MKQNKLLWLLLAFISITYLLNAQTYFQYSVYGTYFIQTQYHYGLNNNDGVWEKTDGDVDKYWGNAARIWKADNCTSKQWTVGPSSSNSYGYIRNKFMYKYIFIYDDIFAIRWQTSDEEFAQKSWSQFWPEYIGDGSYLIWGKIDGTKRLVAVEGTGGPDYTPTSHNGLYTVVGSNNTGRDDVKWVLRPSSTWSNGEFTSRELKVPNYYFGGYLFVSDDDEVPVVSLNFIGGKDLPVGQDPKVSKISVVRDINDNQIFEASPQITSWGTGGTGSANVFKKTTYTKPSDFEEDNCGFLRLEMDIAELAKELYGEEDYLDFSTESSISIPEFETFAIKRDVTVPTQSTDGSFGSSQSTAYTLRLNIQTRIVPESMSFTASNQYFKANFQLEDITESDYATLNFHDRIASVELSRKFGTHDYSSFETISSASNSYTFEKKLTDGMNEMNYFKFEFKGDNGDVLITTYAKLKPELGAPTGVTAIKLGDKTRVSWPTIEAYSDLVLVKYIGDVRGADMNITSDDITSEDDRSYIDIYNEGNCVTHEYALQVTLGSDVLTSEKTTATVFTDDISSALSFFDASKLEYNDKVILEWETSQNDNFDYFVISRSIYKDNLSDADFKDIRRINDTYETQYIDEDTQAGVLYSYRISGHGSCINPDDNSSTKTNTNTLEAVGFRQPMGSVSGQVSFDGGQPVADVRINIEEPGSSSKAVGGSYFLNDSSYFEIPNEREIDGSTLSEFSNGITIELWHKAKEDDSSDHRIFYKDFGLKYNTIDSLFTLYNDSSTATAPMPASFSPETYTHIAFTGKSDDFHLYLDGQEVVFNTNTFSLPATNTDTLYVGGTRACYVDELRVWNKVRIQEDIARDYTRLLNGNEEDLWGYWRLDEGVGSYIFDISQNTTNYEFNKNHGRVKGSNNFWSENTPASSQLSLCAYTDEDGNYLINSVTLKGLNTSYKISPILGVHEFNPSTIPFVISEDNLNQNSKDFSDVSSFNFAGEVFYQGTNVPVVGATVYVDNQQQIDDGGELLVTNETGTFNVEVPIGAHYVSVKKDGHTFASNGQWPAPTTLDPYMKYTFQDDVPLQTFEDLTTVTLVGRFVGGDLEGNKTLALGLSNANVGAAVFKVNTDKGYDISRDEDLSAELEFSTDPLTGEFSIELLPISYNIISAENDNYSIDNTDLGVLNLSEIPDLTTVYDSVYTQEIDDEDTTTILSVDSATYHFERKFIVYANPSIVVTADGESDFGGDATYSYNDETSGEMQTINLKENSPFKFPVFQMTKVYPIHIRLESEYKNYDADENNPVISIVPVPDADITIVNNLEAQEPTYHLTTDENGVVSDYTSFRAGTPNMNADTNNGTSYTKTLAITATTGDVSTTWVGNEVNLYRAYVLGCLDNGGANFVSYGPEIPKFILRDPPGDASYTTLEKGSSYSTSKTYSFADETFSGNETELNLGVTVAAGGGLVGPWIESEITADVSVGVSKTTSMTSEGDYVETYSFSKSFSTSSSAEAVGSMADVYIGEAANFFFTEMTNLRIYPKSYCESATFDYLPNEELNDQSVNFTIGKKPGFAMSGDTTATFFVYSQLHIIETLIPTYRSFIETLMASPKYTSHLSPDDVFYGMANDANIFPDAFANDENAEPSYTFNGTGLGKDIDSVAFLNQQIGLWVNVIAANEAAKIQPDNTFASIENISYDANAGEYSSSVQHTTSKSSTKAHSINFSLTGGVSMGATVNDFGMVSSSEVAQSFDNALSEGSSQETTMTYTYVLDDSDQGDYFSIDVLNNDQAVVEAQESDFLNLDNYTALQALHIADAATNIPLIDPFGSVKSIVVFAAYGGTMAHFKNDIEKSDVSFGLEGASPIFRLRGGQSMCPYEGEEYAMFTYESGQMQPAMLTIGTQNHEAPKIAIEMASMVNVPDGSPAVFELKLMNESPTGNDQTYRLQVDESSNPDGAIIKVDGLSPNRAFFVAAGETLTKTLTVERGASGEMNYENLQLIFHSDCQYDPTNNVDNIADSTTFSASFVPICTSVFFDNINEDWTTNIANQDVMEITVTGYDINASTFEKVYFQYQQSGATPITAMVLYNDTISTDWQSYSGAKLYIDGNSEVSFDWDVSSLNDGEYKLQLTSRCSDGATSISNQMTGVIDRVAPSSFGTPSPADGILSYGENISVLFNENINTGSLQTFGQFGSRSYIQLRGILNGTDLIDSPTLLHDASVHFDGQNDKVVIPNVNLDNTDFTLEFWAKRNATGEETLVSLENLWIGFDAADHFVVEMDDRRIISELTYEAQESWSHFGVSYNRGDDNLAAHFVVTILNDGPVKIKTQEMDIFSSLEGTLTLGNSSNAELAFNGNMHEFRIWNYAKSTDDIASQKSQILSGYEEGLYGLWPMNEAYGSVANDLSFGRNAMMNATWHVSRDGKAVNFEGTNNFVIPTSSMAFDAQCDFTVEFWYKTATPTNVATLMSNGTPSAEENPNAWTISATPENTMVISNNGIDVTFDAENYLDNQWHHFAMACNRIGSLNVYLDAKLVKTQQASAFEGFSAVQLVAGARWNNLVSSDTYDQYMTGTMDEIRVWNSARTKEQLERYMNHTLKGDEMGLKAYFPFEDVTLEDPSLSNESADNFSSNEFMLADDANLESQYYTSETPNMKLQRPEVLIDHTLVLSEKGAIITPNIDENMIENQILEVSVKKVKDLRNNEMLSTLSWSAFIDKNNVVWDMQKLSLIKNVDADTTITVNVMNKGGQNENFAISNIPSWMSVSPSSGQLGPLEVATIEITIGAGLNIGSYQKDINLIANMGYKERLMMDVKVEGNSPNWTANPGMYKQSANVIGQLTIANVISTDIEDIVACFVGDECRGVSQLSYLENGAIYMVMMSIYGSDGDEMEFKVYDASTGFVYSDVTPNITFTANAVYGKISTPLAIEATDYVDQTLTLNEGWNWLSFNVSAQEFSDLNVALADLATTNGDAIVAQATFSTVNDNSWVGSLTEIDATSTYKINVSQPQSFTVSGRQIATDTLHIPILSGWNWIGYPVQSQMSVKEALSSLIPSEDDFIKSQNQFAVYSDWLGWVGSLTYMQPTEGYMLKSANAGTLIYPNVMTKSAGLSSSNSVELPNTEFNMNMIVEAGLSESTNYNIVAYDGDQVCGYAEAKVLADGRTLYFMTINSKGSNGITFIAEGDNNNLQAQESVSFSKNELLGSINNPFTLTFNSTDNASVVNSDVTGVKVYPNPFSDKAVVSLYSRHTQLAYLELFTISGNKIMNRELSLKEGSYTFDILDNINIPKGVYILKAIINDDEVAVPIIKE